MKTGNKIIGAILILVIVAGLSYGLRQKSHASKVEVAVEKPAEKKSTDTLHFAADAPQLEFIRSKPVNAYPEPLMDGLNARITYDDNYTARVYSPIAGRVTKISVEAGQQVKAGDPLLWIDSPDFASGASDSLKADADLLRKKVAYERAKGLYEVKGLALKDLESAEADWHQAEAEAQLQSLRTLLQERGINPDQINP